MTPSVASHAGTSVTMKSGTRPVRRPWFEAVASWEGASGVPLQARDTGKKT
jgi:hypothetical protein